MCGRAAQRLSTVDTAASYLGATMPPRTHDSRNRQGQQDQDSSANNNDDSSSLYGSPFHRNVQNMSPGYTFYVFHKGQHHEDDQQHNMEEATVMCSSKVWGLVTRPGTVHNPLPPGPSKHFSNFMFNARSEEAADKISFGKLIRTGQSCVVALDGFYEWKVPPNNTLSKERSGRKQPYLVHRSDGQPLFIAGLHTSVAIGRPEDGRLSTFTIFTTAASPQLSWLHTRMPLILFDLQDVKEWIQNPTPALLQQLSTKVSQSTYPEMTWHSVTKKMSNSSYQGYDCMDPVELETIPSVKSFFAKKTAQPQGKDATTKTGNQAQETTSMVDESPATAKRPLTMEDFATKNNRKNDDSSGDTASIENKRIKIDSFPASSSKEKQGKGKATITSFFSPKKTK